MDDMEKIEAFLAGEIFAVVGASGNRAKYGNKVLRAYQQQGMTVYAVNPRAAKHGEMIEGEKAWGSLSDLVAAGVNVDGVSVITHSSVTEAMVEEAGELGVKYVWMQPGAESDLAIERAEELGIGVIARGACFLVVVGYRER